MTESTLIRGARIVSLDDAIGELDRGDIQIDHGRITAVGADLDDTGREVIDGSRFIAMPGLIDAHRHSWTSVLRGVVSDWTFGQYMGWGRAVLGPLFRPEDLYASTLLSAATGLDAGVTTTVDFAHIMNSPEHADAAIEAWRVSGSRAVFAHGTPQDQRMHEYHVNSSLGHPDDIRRIRSSVLDDDSALVTLAAALRGPDFSTLDTTEADWRLARELGIRMTLHAGVIRMDQRVVHELDSRGLLGPDVNFVHGQYFDGDELRLVADSGASITLSPELELQMNIGLPPFAAVLDAGILPSLALDMPASISEEMFTPMRSAMGIVRSQEQLASFEGGAFLSSYSLTSRDYLKMATIEGARAFGLDDRIGSLTPGKDADIILIRADGLHMRPISNVTGQLVLSARASDVDTVFVRGRAVKRDGRLLLDSEAIASAAEQSRDYFRDAAPDTFRYATDPTAGSGIGTDFQA